MSLFVLDTDILSLYQLGDPSVCRHVLERSPQDLTVTIITVEEQMRAWFTQCRRAKKAEKLAAVYERFAQNVRFLARIEILSFTKEAIDEFERLRRMKLGVASNDLRIAAIAIKNSAIVVTRNRIDFGRIPGLAIEDWSK